MPRPKRSTGGGIAGKYAWSGWIPLRAWRRTATPRDFGSGPNSAAPARVWSTRFDPGSNLVEVHVSRLRDKLGAHAWMVETVRGAGYRLRAHRAD